MAAPFIQTPNESVLNRDEFEYLSIVLSLIGQSDEKTCEMKRNILHSTLIMKVLGSLMVTVKRIGEERTCEKKNQSIIFLFRIQAL